MKRIVPGHWPHQAGQAAPPAPERLFTGTWRSRAWRTCRPGPRQSRDIREKGDHDPESPGRRCRLVREYGSAGAPGEAGVRSTTAQALAARPGQAGGGAVHRGQAGGVGFPAKPCWSITGLSRRCWPRRKRKCWSPTTRPRKPRRPSWSGKRRTTSSRKRWSGYGQALEGEPVKWRTITHLLLITGARRGELCGLRWRSNRLGKPAVQRSTGPFSTPRTGASMRAAPKPDNVRFIKLPQETMELLAGVPGLVQRAAAAQRGPMDGKRLRVCEGGRAAP